jgi:poly(3-hydroxybutyrate) depolymerase
VSKFAGSGRLRARRPVSCVLGLLGLIAFLLPAAGASAESAADDRLFQKVAGVDTPGYLVHLPAGYAASEETFPLLLFLHGIAQKGDGGLEALDRVAEDGPFRTMRDGFWDESLPLVVVGPQSGGLQPWWRGEEVRKVLAHIRSTYRVDPRRNYLAGISMGGRSVWWLAANFPGEFAAMVPASAWAGEIGNRCTNLAHLAVWAFHGERDTLIGLSAGQRPVDALNTCEVTPALPARLTVLDAGHGQWDRVFANGHRDANTGGDGRTHTDIYRWLLSFSL